MYLLSSKPFLLADSDFNVKSWKILLCNLLHINCLETGIIQCIRHVCSNKSLGHLEYGFSWQNYLLISSQKTVKVRLLVHLSNFFSKKNHLKVQVSLKIASIKSPSFVQMFFHKSLVEYCEIEQKTDFILDGSPGFQHNTNLVKSLLLRKEELRVLHSPLVTIGD